MPRSLMASWDVVCARVRLPFIALTTRQVSGAWRTISEDNDVWSSACRRRWPYNKQLGKGRRRVVWKRLYRETFDALRYAQPSRGQIVPLLYLLWRWGRAALLPCCSRRDLANGVHPAAIPGQPLPAVPSFLVAGSTHGARCGARRCRPGRSTRPRCTRPAAWCTSCPATPRIRKWVQRAGRWRGSRAVRAWFASTRCLAR